MSDEPRDKIVDSLHNRLKEAWRTQDPQELYHLCKETLHLYERTRRELKGWEEGRTRKMNFPDGSWDI